MALAKQLKTKQKSGFITMLSDILGAIPLRLWNVLTGINCIQEIIYLK